MTRPALFDTGPRQTRVRGPTSLVPAPARCAAIDTVSPRHLSTTEAR